MKYLISSISLLLIASIAAEAPLTSNYLSTLRVGIAPSYFSKTGSIVGIAPTLPDLIIPLSDNPTFSKSWKVPFQLSAEIGRALFEHIEIFLEFMYQRASGTSHDFNVLFPGEHETVWRLNLTPFSAYGGYFGIRRYTDRTMSNCFSWFYGVKFGLVHHSAVSAKPFSVEIPSVATVDNNLEWFQSDTGVSGGIQAGFDSKICGCIHLFFNAELLSSVGLVPGQPVPLSSPIFNIAAISHTGTGALIAFPLTLGLRYYF